MRVQYWKGGLQRHEVQAIEKIKNAFSISAGVSRENKVSSDGSSLSLQDQLAANFPDLVTNGSSEWKGYAGFRFVGAKNDEGEFDLVIVTDHIVIVVELKHWHGVITSNGSSWFQNDKVHPSPVNITRRKQFLLREKLSKIKHRLRSKRVPFVADCIVMTANCDISKLPHSERSRVYTLNEFLALSDPEKFSKAFRIRPDASGLCKYINVFDNLFSEGAVEPADLVASGFRAKIPLFKHPEGLFQEFEAYNDYNPLERALLRSWDFSNLKDGAGHDTEVRATILGRERDVLTRLKNHSAELAASTLRNLSFPSPQDIVVDQIEVFELPLGYQYLNEFIDKTLVNYPETERMNLFRVILKRFEEVHKLGVAHRDIGGHALWISSGHEIVISSFIAAYIESAKTVGPLRSELEIGAIAIPEDTKVKDTNFRGGTPFQRDVFALALLGWHLLHAQRLPLLINRAKVEEVRHALSDTDEALRWYSKILLDSLAGTPAYRPGNAGELLDRINTHIPPAEEVALFSMDLLESYVKERSFNLNRQYPMDQEIDLGADKESYLSGGYFVKAWLGAFPAEKEEHKGLATLDMLQQLERLQSDHNPSIAPISDFGLEQRSRLLYVVQAKVEGAPWHADVAGEIRQQLVIQLIRGVERLHSINVFHGDLQPSNLLIQLDKTGKEAPPKLWIIDVPDLGLCYGGEERFNTRYSPPFEDRATARERDNYAVMRLVVEMLGYDWDNPQSISDKALAQAIETERSSEEGYISLERFKSAIFREANQAPPVSKITVFINARIVRHQGFELLPDNGKIYIVVDAKAVPDKHLVQISFFGVGGVIDLVYDTREKKLIECKRAQKQRSIPSVAFRKAAYRPALAITVKPIQASHDFRELNRIVRQDADFAALLEDEVLLDLDSETQAPASHTEEKFDTTRGEGGSAGSASVDAAVPEQNEPPSISADAADTISSSSLYGSSRLISTADIWRATMKAEREARPGAIVSAPVKLWEQGKTYVIPYSSATDLSDRYEPGARVTIFLNEDNSRRRKLGMMDVAQSTSARLFLIYPLLDSEKIEVGAQLDIVSSLEESSFRRREKALDAILNQNAVLPNLADYFEAGSSVVPTHYEVAIGDEVFNRYRQVNTKDQPSGFNEAQKNAFKRVLTTGPVSLLQGPPGTGKTKFIAALAHYLVDEMRVNNILLVSQSHEAVNTAAERIRTHCREQSTPLNVVRFSNNEVSVSDGLKDVYSRALVHKKANQLEVELKSRLSKMAASLGVNKAFMESLVDFESHFHDPLNNLSELKEHITGLGESDDSEAKKSLQARLDYYQSLIVDRLSKHGYDCDPSSDVEALVLNARERLGSAFGIYPHEMAKCLKLLDISRNYTQRMKSTGNYDEFLVRSRTLVCGTCVGIGLGHLKIADRIFDWVIIDEASRSSASELAVAMRCGKRILLVGDHRQLPPTYEQEHEKKIAAELRMSARSERFVKIMASDFAKAFESTYGKQAGSTLDTQYRMLPPIGTLVSQIFYDSELKNGERPEPSCFQEAPSSFRPVVQWLDTSPCGRSAHHAETVPKSGKIYNSAEIDAIINLLTTVDEDPDFLGQLEQLSSNQPAIGVICMYAEQKRRLLRKFNESDFSDAIRGLVRIDTVDSYQGKENRIVIVSVTRSGSSGPGFLRSPNRINVAMSRAMDRLVVVGDSRMWEGRYSDLPLGRTLSYIRSQASDNEYLVRGVNKIVRQEKGR